MHEVHEACPRARMQIAVDNYVIKKHAIFIFSAKIFHLQSCRGREFLDHEFANLTSRRIEKRKPTIFCRSRMIFEDGSLF